MIVIYRFLIYRAAFSLFNCCSSRNFINSVIDAESKWFSSSDWKGQKENEAHRENEEDTREAIARMWIDSFDNYGSSTEVDREYIKDTSWLNQS